MRQTSLTRLYETHRDSLSLIHVSGPLEARLSVGEERIWPADLVGHLNLIHPTRLQVLGSAELAWAQRHSNEKVAHHLNEILSAHPPAIIVADGCEVPNILHGICEAHAICDRLLDGALAMDDGRPRDDISVIAISVQPGQPGDEVRRQSGRLTLS